MGEKFFQIVSRNPRQKSNLLRFMASQSVGIRIGMAGSPGEYEFHIAAYILKSFNQKMAVFFRRESSQEENVVVCNQVPLDQLPGKPSRCECSSVRNVNRIAFVLPAVVLLQRARDDHGRIRSGNRGRLSPAQHPRCDAPPLATLPIETLHGYNRLFAGKPGQKRKQCWPQAMVMDDIVVRHHRVRRAQQRMNESFEMLRTYGW